MRDGSLRVARLHECFGEHETGVGIGWIQGCRDLDMFKGLPAAPSLDQRVGKQHPRLDVVRVRRERLLRQRSGLGDMRGSQFHFSKPHERRGPRWIDEE